MWLLPTDRAPYWPSRVIISRRSRDNCELDCMTTCTREKIYLAAIARLPILICLTVQQYGRVNFSSAPCKTTCTPDALSAFCNIAVAWRMTLPRVIACGALLAVLCLPLCKSVGLVATAHHAGPDGGIAGVESTTEVIPDAGLIDLPVRLPRELASAIILGFSARCHRRGSRFGLVMRCTMQRIPACSRSSAWQLNCPQQKQ